MPVSCEAGDLSGDFFLVRATQPREAVERVRKLVVERIPERFGMDPVRDVQVLVPMHRGEAGSKALNANAPRAPESGGERRAVRAISAGRQSDAASQ